MERSSLLLSRGARPWQGRALEGSGGSGARFWTSAVLRGRVLTFGLEGSETVAGAYSRGLWRQRRVLLDVRGFAWKGPHFWPGGQRNRGKGVLKKALAVARALAAAARAFGRPRFCVERSSLLLSRAAKPWQGHALEGFGGSGACFWTSAVLRGKVLTFALEGRETVAGACSRVLWR